MFFFLGYSELKGTMSECCKSCEKQIIMHVHHSMQGIKIDNRNTHVLWTGHKRTPTCGQGCGTSEFHMGVDCPSREETKPRSDLVNQLVCLFSQRPIPTLKSVVDGY